MAMINVKKKVEKSASKLGLAPGETVIEACSTNPSGSVKKMVGMQLGGAVGAAIAAKRGNDVEQDDEGLAGRFPTGRLFLVLTDQRLFVASMGAMSGNPKELLAEWSRDEVADITVEKGRLASPLTVTFSDGSSAEVDGAKGTNPAGLAEAFAGS